VELRRRSRTVGSSLPRPARPAPRESPAGRRSIRPRAAAPGPPAGPAPRPSGDRRWRTFMPVVADAQLRLGRSGRSPACRQVVRAGCRSRRPADGFSFADTAGFMRVSRVGMRLRIVSQSSNGRSGTQKRAARHRPPRTLQQPPPSRGHPMTPHDSFFRPRRPRCRRHRWRPGIGEAICRRLAAAAPASPSSTATGPRPYGRRSVRPCCGRRRRIRGGRRPAPPRPAAALGPVAILVNNAGITGRAARTGS
jgi:hypothetical protein